MNIIKKEIEITTEFIKLDQLLKFSEIVDSGGLAKILIREEAVKFNGEIMTMRGKKVRSGDEIEVDFSILDSDIDNYFIIKVK